jgi:lipopolysaccharide exporter
MPHSDKSTPGKSPFSRDVLALITGTTISQIITILSAPVITRLYGPEAFGLLAIFTSISSLIGVIVCLRYELAIMLPESDEEAANVLGLCMLIISLMSISSILVVVFLSPYLETILKSSQIGDYFWLIPPSVFLSGTFLALNFWNTRTRQFQRLAVVQVFRSVSITGTQLGFGLAGCATGGILIGASVIGQLVSTLGLGFQIIRDHLSFFRHHITLEKMAAAFKRYSNFPKYSVAAALLNNICLIMPVFILTAYFNPTVVGYYSLGLMVLQFPLSFIQSAIAQVFFQRAAEAKNISPQKLKETVQQTIKPLIFVAIIPVILLALIGPEIFSVIFGAKWEEAGNYVRFLSLWVGIRFIASPISNLFSVFEKQHLTVILTIFELVFPLIAIIIGALSGTALVAIILFSIAAFLINIVTYCYLLRLSGISIRVLGKTVMDFFLLSLPFILCILAIQRLFALNNLLIMVFSVLVFMLFPVLVIKRDAEIAGIVKNVTRQIPVISRISSYLN